MPFPPREELLTWSPVQKSAYVAAEQDRKWLLAIARNRDLFPEGTPVPSRLASCAPRRRELHVRPVTRGGSPRVELKAEVYEDDDDDDLFVSPAPADDGTRSPPVAQTQTRALMKRKAVDDSHDQTDSDPRSMSVSGSSGRDSVGLSPGPVDFVARDSSSDVRSQSAARSRDVFVSDASSHAADPRPARKKAKIGAQGRRGSKSSSKSQASSSSSSAVPTPPAASAAPTPAPVPAPPVIAPGVLPEWYASIDTKSRLMQTAPKRDMLAFLSNLKSDIRACVQDPRNPESFAKLRERIHQIEFKSMDKYTLRKANILDGTVGLPRVCAPADAAVFPFDIRADALALFTRWSLGVFSIDLLRGIRHTGRKQTDKSKRNADSIDPAFPGRRRANFHGAGHLVNGQWWPTQLCCVRDGAHGAAQGGIFGAATEGAYSVVLSGGNHYGDEDHGDTIWYRGTDGDRGIMTENTRRLTESAQAYTTAAAAGSPDRPVRVLRSHQLDRANRFRPARGLRYDGLYDVVASELLDPARQIWRFRLVRRPGQDPIRSEGPACRPTAYEIREFDRLRERGGVLEE